MYMNAIQCIGTLFGAELAQSGRGKFKVDQGARGCPLMLCLLCLLCLVQAEFQAQRQLRPSQLVETCDCDNLQCGKGYGITRRMLYDVVWCVVVSLRRLGEKKLDKDIQV